MTTEIEKLSKRLSEVEKKLFNKNIEYENSFNSGKPVEYSEVVILQAEKNNLEVLIEKKIIEYNKAEKIRIEEEQKKQLEVKKNKELATAKKVNEKMAALLVELAEVLNNENEKLDSVYNGKGLFYKLVYEHFIPGIRWANLNGGVSVAAPTIKKVKNEIESYLKKLN